MKLPTIEKKTPLDKYIYTNLKMVENEIAVSCSTSVCAVLSLAFLVFWMIIPLYFLIGFVFIFNGAKKIFYTSVYGESSVFYNAFPVDSKTLVIGKITAAFIGVFLYSLITIIAFVPFSGILSIVFDNINLPEIDVSNIITFASVLSLEFISFLCVTLATISIIFLAITLYNKTEILNIGNIRSAVYVLLTFLLSSTILNLTGTFDKVGVEYAMWMPALQIVVALLAAYFSIRKTIAAFENY